MLTNLALLGFLVVIGFAVARLRNLFAAVMLFSIYSLVSAALFVVLDAVDVAFTEAGGGCRGVEHPDACDPDLGQRPGRVESARARGSDVRLRADRGPADLRDVRSAGGG